MQGVVRDSGVEVAAVGVGQDLFHSLYPSVQPSRKRIGSTERKHIHLRVVSCEWLGS